MPPKTSRTYGKKKTVLPATTAAIFTAPSPVKKKQQDPSAAPTIIQDEIITISEDTVHVQDSTDHDSPSSPEALIEALTALDLNTTVPTTPQQKHAPQSPLDPSIPSHLHSLLSLSKSDNLPITLEAWDSILPPQSTLTKIAEASFAEVYRITTPSATSIVKIMPLKHNMDKLSLTRSFASPIEDVIPELRIMNTLTEIPGFVTFKGARIVTGNQSEEFVKAWELWGLRDGYVPEEGWEWDSEFEHPSNYGSEASFLAIELGDAGDVLEDVIVDSVEKFWDIWLGTVIALARAEALNEFEHRDLHENNICVYTHPQSTRKYDENEPYFGRSGLEITIIDYGLSRARLADDHITFKDLESDLEVFRGKKWHRQFETYRQMRSHLYTGTLEQLPLNWHKNNKSTQQLADAGKSWEDYTPQSNVFWLSYLLDYLIIQYTTHGPSKKKSNNKKVILDMLAELGDWLDFDPKTRIDDSCERFASAGECLDFCVEVGWIGEEQLGVGEGSFLSIRGDFQEEEEGVDGKDVNEIRESPLQPTTPHKATSSRQNAQHTFFSPFVEQPAPLPTPQPAPGSTRQLRPRTPSPAKIGKVPLPATDSSSPSKAMKVKRSKSKSMKVPSLETSENVMTLPTRRLRSRKGSVDM